MAPVHHYGKNPESGLRGASAWKGSADVIEGVLADIDQLTGRTSNRELVCTKARDGEQGPISPFDLEFIELGLKDDGEIYGSCCVVPSTREQSRFGTIRGQSKSQTAVLGAINEAIDSVGKIIVPRIGMPQVRAAKVNDIRKEFDRLYVVDGDDPAKVEKAKQKAFRRAIDSWRQRNSAPAHARVPTGSGKQHDTASAVITSNRRRRQLLVIGARTHRMGNGRARTRTESV